jgi:V8-like Glu-specific endopeptidase
MLAKVLWIIVALVVFPVVARGESPVPYQVSEAEVAQTETYWTQERMAQARSYPLRKLKGTPAHRGASVPATPNGYEYPPPQTTFVWDSAKALNLYTQYPFKAIGKVFFTEDGNDFVCSGTSVGGRAVLTAGHCVSNGKGTYHANWIFVPAYSKVSANSNGYKAPFGRWTAEWLWAFDDFHLNSSLCRDVAFAVTENKEGMTLSKRVGALPINVNQPSSQHWNQFGYPADPPYDGHYLVQTQASFSAYANQRVSVTCAPQPVGMGSTQTGGANGGPWILGLDPYELNAGGNYVNSISSFGYKEGEMFGPYFDDEVKAAYETFTAESVSCRKHEYAVYLSPGYQEGVRWGGFHATITHFSANHACGRDQKKTVRNAWTKIGGGEFYSFSGKKRKTDYWASNLSTKWGVRFNSSLLDSLASELKEAGFKAEEPRHWHISLYETTGKAAITTFESKFKNIHWRLFLVQKPNENCQTKGTDCHPEEWELIW